MNDWVCVFTTDQAHRAELIRMVLEDKDIEAVVVNKKDSAYITIGFVEVYVPSKDVILAKHIIQSEEL